LIAAVFLGAAFAALGAALAGVDERFVAGFADFFIPFTKFKIESSEACDVHAYG
jgi:hypothetical protein